MKNIPYSISNDFLKDAQWLEPLLIEVDEKPIIENLDHKFCSFGSCFAQNLQSFMLPFGFHFYFERQICAYYQVKAMENLFLRLLDEEDYSDDRIYEFSKTDHMVYEYFRLRHYGKSSKELVLNEISDIKLIHHFLYILSIDILRNRASQKKVIVRFEEVLIFMSIVIYN